MTSRGCLESDFETIADFLHTAAQIAISVQREHGKLPKSYLKGLQSNNEVVELRNRVESFSAQFAMPGFETWMVLQLHFEMERPSVALKKIIFATHHAFHIYNLRSFSLSWGCCLQKSLVAVYSVASILSSYSWEGPCDHQKSIWYYRAFLL